MTKSPPRSRRPPTRTVVALGGNAITRSGDAGTVEEDYANLERSLEGVVDLLDEGYELLITHGNGPQVGNQLIRVEMARGRAPDLPLDVVVADLQGGLGYMIESVLRTKLMRRNLQLPLCTLLTLIEVDREATSRLEPTKFIGPFFEEGDVARLESEYGWAMRRDGDRGWRRVVASPQPLRVIESGLIRTLIDAGALVIVAGGGGIPVARSDDGALRGVEGVIDKDLASALLAHDVGATDLYLLTSVDTVQLDYGTPRARSLRYVTVDELRAHEAEGQFPAGSMGPKIEAAARFLRAGGRRVLITDIFALGRALRGETGTWITP